MQENMRKMPGTDNLPDASEITDLSELKEEEKLTYTTNFDFPYAN